MVHHVWLRARNHIHGGFCPQSLYSEALWTGPKYFAPLQLGFITGVMRLFCTLIVVCHGNMLSMIWDTVPNKCWMQLLSLGCNFSTWTETSSSSDEFKKKSIRARTSFPRKTERCSLGKKWKMATSPRCLCHDSEKQSVVTILPSNMAFVILIKCLLNVTINSSW